MQVWKMTIKPSKAHEDRNPFSWCRERGVVGVGWAEAYKGLAVERSSDSLLGLFQKGWPEPKSVPHEIRKLFEEVSAEDIVWLHKDGAFYLCEISDDQCLCGPMIGDDFFENDIGHARRASWIEVPEDLVPGSVQRATIAPRMIQRIKCSEVEIQYFQRIKEVLNRNPAWRPVFDFAGLTRCISELPARQLFAYMSPDDCEDIVAGYLQDQRWLLVKSSCFRSKPRYEFRMVRETNQGEREVAYVQVKSGPNVQLRPDSYAKDCGERRTVFLFSASPDPYPGPSVEGVKTIDHSIIRDWMKEHPTLLPHPLLMRLLVEVGND